MPYKEFEKGDVFKNTIKASPEFKFKIYAGNIYLNNSKNGYTEIKKLNIITTTGCEIPNSFDFTCEDNSYNISLI